MRVDVYYNLHKKCLSIRHKGKVIHHTQTVELDDVTFVVSEKGRRRVVKTRRKNVHAVIRGTLINYGLNYRNIDKRGSQVTYNPYIYKTFVLRKNAQPIHSAYKVIIVDKNIYKFDNPLDS